MRTEFELALGPTSPFSELQFISWTTSDSITEFRVYSFFNNILTVCQPAVSDTIPRRAISLPDCMAVGTSLTWASSALIRWWSVSHLHLLTVWTTSTSVKWSNRSIPVVLSSLKSSRIRFKWFFNYTTIPYCSNTECDAPFNPRYTHTHISSKNGKWKNDTCRNVSCVWMWKRDVT